MKTPLEIHRTELTDARESVLRWTNLINSTQDESLLLQYAMCRSHAERRVSDAIECIEREQSKSK